MKFTRVIQWLKSRREKAVRKQFRRGYEYALGRITLDGASAIELEAEYSTAFDGGPEIDAFDAGIREAVSFAVDSGLIPDTRVL